MRRNVLNVGLMAISAMVAPLANGQAGSMKQAESILDKLEKSLLDQQPDALSFGEKVKGQTPPTAKESVPSYSYAPGKPIESDGGGANFKELSALVTGLENEVDKLASAVQQTKQKIVDDASIDNFVTFEAALANSDHAAIKSLSVRLDGYDVYGVDDSSGLWMPSKKIPLYAGPLKPGSHRLDVEARIVMKHKKALPLNNDVYRLINKTFEVTIPSGNVNKTYRIDIEPPTSVEQGVTATLKQL